MRRCGDGSTITVDKSLPSISAINFDRLTFGVEVVFECPKSTLRDLARFFEGRAPPSRDGCSSVIVDNIVVACLETFADAVRACARVTGPCAGPGPSPSESLLSEISSALSFPFPFLRELRLGRFDSLFDVALDCREVSLESESAESTSPYPSELPASSSSASLCDGRAGWSESLGSSRLRVPLSRPSRTASRLL